MKNSRFLAVGPSLTKANGGPYKTVLQFLECRPGRVLSLGNETHDAPVQRVPVRKSKIGTQYSIPTKEGRELLGHAVASADILQCHMLFRYHVGYLSSVSKRENIPLWVVPHGCLDPYVFTYRRIRKLLWMHLIGKTALKQASKIICSTKEELRKASPWLRDCDAVVIPWYVDPPENVPSMHERAGLRVRFFGGSQGRFLLFLGRLHEMKRPIEAARLFLRASASAGAKLVFVGSGSDSISKELQRLSSESAGKILFLGGIWGKDRDAVLNACDGYWSYSHRENFNHAAVECMAAGLPTILSPGNDIISEIGSEMPAWLLPAKGEDATARSLRLWESCEEVNLRKFGLELQELVIRRLSKRLFVERLENLLGKR